MLTRHAVLVLAIQAALINFASAQDHLVPERSMLNMVNDQWDYHKKVRDVLLKNAAEYHLARMVCLPTASSEWVVTLVREGRQDSDAPPAYFVEFVGAEENLFRAQSVVDVKVKKSRAALDLDTAESLNKAWRRMLHMTRYSKEDVPGADGDTYHFSRFVPLFDRGKDDPLAGWEVGSTWSPEDGSLCGELVAIGEELKDFALAQPEKREKVLSEIRSKSKALMAKLDLREKKT